MIELAASWVTDPDAAREAGGGLGPLVGWTVLFWTLGFMLLPAAVGMLVLLGILS